LIPRLAAGYLPFGDRDKARRDEQRVVIPPM